MQGSEWPAYITLACLKCLILNLFYVFWESSIYSDHHFLFGCVSGGVNVNETFMLPSDWRRSASLLWPKLSHPLHSAWIPPWHRHSAFAAVCVCMYGSVCLHAYCICLSKRTCTRACVCVSAYVCAWVPVSVANMVSQSWLLVTMLQQGDLWVDGVDKHMMWL